MDLSDVFGLASPAGSDKPPVSPRTWVSCSNELAHTLLAALHRDPSHRLDAPGLLARLAEAAELQAAEDEEGATRRSPTTTR